MGKVHFKTAALCAFALLVAGCNGTSPPPNDSPALSPINISRQDVSPASPEWQEIEFDYNPSLLNMENDGRTIKHNAAASESFIKLGNVKYNLRELQFRRPSEHTIDGKQYDMEAQFRHENEEGEIIMVAVLLDLAKDWKEAGKENELVFDEYSPFWDWAHKVENSGDTFTSPIDAEIDLNKLLPDDRDYFRYDGSETSPPNKEVTWVVMQTPMSTGWPEERSKVQGFMGSVAQNDSQIQELNGRKVLESRDQK